MSISIPEKRTLLTAGRWLGLGVLVHDFAHQVWQLKGFHNLVEGGYVGLFIYLACVIGLRLVD